MFLVGVNLPDKKAVSIALSEIYGIGRKTGKQICDKLSISRQTRLGQLPQTKIIQLTEYLNTLTIESELRREVRNNIASLAEMGSYRGDRHMNKLPTRGIKSERC